MNGKIIHLKTVTSTQDVARRLIAVGRAGVGEIVVAEAQTSGRGRFGRGWSSPLGGLYATFILPRFPLIPIHAAVSIVSALDRFGLRTGIKWPNDIVIGRAKLGGVIIEEVDGSALVGVGINLREAPLRSSTCAAEHGLKIDRDRLIDAISDRLRVRRESGELIDGYLARSTTIGLPVSVVRGPGERPIVGVARGIDDRGRLLVEAEDRIQPVASGECFHLRHPAVDAGRSRPLS